MLLIGLMVVAFVVLALARAVGPEPGGTATPGLSPAASTPALSPSTSPVPTASPTTAPSVTPASSPTSSPTASPTPAATATSYRVKAGDTLSAIAARFGVSVTAIAEANGITNPSLIRIGQVLVIPAP